MIIAQIASLPERVESLKRTVDSLYKQVNLIQVALNGYDSVPSFILKDLSIRAILTDNKMGDANKFLDIEDRSGYLFTCDDDLIYPSTYCADMIEAVDRYKCIVTLHGHNWNTPFVSYRDIRDNFRCLGNVDKPARVQVGGTGVMAWHSDTFKLHYEDFKSANMADIWVAKVAQEQGVPIMVIPHTENYLIHTSFRNNIYANHRRADGHKTEEELLKTFL